MPPRRPGSSAPREVSSVVSIELLLDDAAEARIRDDWQRLEQAGMSSLGAHRAPSNRPHLTLLVRPALRPVRCREAARMLPVEVDLVEPVVFAHGDRGVLAWMAAPTPDLIELHRAVHAAVPPGEDAPYTAPGEWTPHVTLARRLRLDSLDEALSLVGAPLAGAGVALRRWDSATATVSAVD